MLDQFYTPSHIALNLLSELDSKNISYVADFAVGDGSLLKNFPFSTKEIIGLDVDPNAINHLKSTQPTWNLQTGDFLNPDNATTEWLSVLSNKLDLILLNPPFSCRGQKRIDIAISNDLTLSCRTSLAFVYNALKYLNSTGILIAIVPLSTMKSEADANVFKHLEPNWNVSFGEKYGPTAFKGCFPNSVILTLRRRTKNIDSNYSTSHYLDNYKFNAQILRGSVPMYRTLDKGKFPVLHTKNLQAGRVVGKLKYLDNPIRHVQGTYLCIPRVGLPNKDKFVIIQNQDYVLSDCLIAVRSDCIEQTIIIKQLIFDKWNTFKALYDSTCAPYITINQLRAFLSDNNISTELVTKFTQINRCDDNCVDLHTINKRSFASAMLY